MATFRVVLTGTSREVYDVEADTAEEARENWADGHRVASEVNDLEVETVTNQED